MRLKKTIAATAAAAALTGAAVTTASSASADTTPTRCGFQTVIRTAGPNFAENGNINLELQETNDPYYVGAYNTGAFNVVATPDGTSTAQQQWSAEQLPDGNYRVWNLASGHVLQSTTDSSTGASGTANNYPLSSTQYHIVAGLASWNIPNQEWRMADVMGTNFLTNVATNAALEVDTSVNYRGNPAWHPVIADATVNSTASDGEIPSSQRTPYVLDYAQWDFITDNYLCGLPATN